MLEIKNISYRYKRSSKDVFTNFSLTLHKGGIYGLLGRNGVGKSTLLHNCMGLLLPQQGQILLEGTDVSKRLPSTLAKSFLVPEDFELPPMSLKKYIQLNAPFYPDFSLTDMDKYLQAFNLSTDVPMLSTLSMGQKKKVFMCFAMAANTELILMDEPTNGLDIPSKSQFRKIVASCMNDNRCIVISTHQVADIDSILDHVIIAEPNCVLLNASVADICAKFSFSENAENAIFSQPSLGGMASIAPNTDGCDSALNLELLFNATLAQPELIKQIMNN